MKKIFTILSALVMTVFCAANASAQERETVVSVYLQIGDVEYYKLADKPTATFTNDILVVESESFRGEYDYSLVSHFAFEDANDVMAIEEVGGDKASFSMSYTDNATVNMTAPDLKWAKVFSVQGVEVTAANADENGSLTLDVSGLAPGVYVVTPSCHSAVKIVKR